MVFLLSKMGYAAFLMGYVSNSSDLRSKFKVSGGKSMKEPFLNWCCGLALVIGLPLGLLVALTERSLLAGFAITKLS